MHSGHSGALKFQLAIALVLLTSLNSQPSQLPALSTQASASPTGNGTGQVTPWPNTPGRQLNTSEAALRAVSVAGVTSLSSSATLAAVPFAGDTGQLVLTFLGMTGFVLFIILRRLRYAKRFQNGARRIENAKH